MITLTRRFILLSLVFAIFAMLLAAAVARADRSDGAWIAADRLICTAADRSTCPTSF